MKRLAKALLYRLGLGRAAERLYFNVKTASPLVLVNEIKIRTFGAQSQPVPPGPLIYDVIACRWADVYLKSGRLLTDDLRRTLGAAGYTFGRDDKVLDFGCGCGRLTRFLIRDTESQIFGTDFNPTLVAWCRENLSGGTFTVNALEPPLPFGAATFDLVIARSVFTHLTEDMQLRWIDEMRRVIRPGGLMYFSMHGPLLSSGLSTEQRARFDAGELVVIYREAEGENLCSSFAGPQFVHSRLSNGFEGLCYEPGRHSPHLRQDVYVFRRT